MVAPSRSQALGGAALIALGVLAAYHNCFGTPFVYDDQLAIVENPSIRHLWPAWGALFSEPADTTVGGRPVANLTLALNYALSGTEVWSYHALNVLIHILAGLALFGVVRRTLMGPVLKGRFGRDALPLSLAIALLWTLHPLQTECVTYVVQRVESVMGLFYLLTLYCFIRSVDSPRPTRWLACSVAACLLGVATKEVAATAPFMVLLYDRTFVAGTFREAWRRRRSLYLALAATWLPLAGLVASTGWSRGGSAGFNAGVSPAAYWLTQFEAIVRYLGLSVWPRTLVFDYGPFRVGSIAEVLPYALVVIALAAATLVALRRRPALGILGAWFFIILAPSSIVPVATQSMAEHRMYLPLAAVATAAVAGIYTVAGRRFLPMLVLLALLLGFLTTSRNEVYASDLSLWTDTVAKRPDNANARCDLGLAFFNAGRVPESIQQYKAALELQPAYPAVYNNLGNALDRSGRTPEAIGLYETAIRLEPGFAAAHYNLAKAFWRTGRNPEAIGQFEEALRIEPNHADAHIDLGEALIRAGRLPEAIEQFEAALRIRPDYARADFYLGNALVESGKFPEAVASYEAALRIQPDMAEASNNLGIVLCRTGRVQDGIGQIETAIREQPNFAMAHFSRGMAMLQLGRKDEAIAEFENVLKLQPNDPSASKMLGLVQGSR
jgi:tetratricopeptide (TPR) repeat protein